MNVHGQECDVSEKSLKAKPLLCCQHGDCSVVCLSFSSGNRNVSGIGFHFAGEICSGPLLRRGILFSFCFPRGVLEWLTYCWAIVVHLFLFSKGLCVPWVFSGGSAVAETQIKGLGLSLRSSSSVLSQTECPFWCLYREYENLKEARKMSNEMTEKLKKELFAVNSKVKGKCES